MTTAVTFFNASSLKVVASWNTVSFVVIGEGKEDVLTKVSFVAYTSWHLLVCRLHLDLIHYNLQKAT